MKKYISIFLFMVLVGSVMFFSQRTYGSTEPDPGIVVPPGIEMAPPLSDLIEPVEIIPPVVKNDIFIKSPEAGSYLMKKVTLIADISEMTSDLSEGKETPGEVVGEIGTTPKIEFWQVYIGGDSLLPTKEVLIGEGNCVDSLCSIVWDTFGDKINPVIDGAYQVWVKTSDGLHVSERVNVNVDNTAPIITIAEYDIAPINTDITVKASTNEGTLNVDSYTFTDNGSFDFIATDRAGNITTTTVTIKNIDKIVPVITLAPYTTTKTNQDITVTATTDEGSLNADSYTFTANGSFDFVAKDEAGNVTTTTVTISNIDKTPPVITIAPYTTTITNQEIIVTASTNEGTLNTSSHTFTANGSFDFIATDEAGNVTTLTVTITNIDKTPPVIVRGGGGGGGRPFMYTSTTPVITTPTLPVVGKVLGASTFKFTKYLRKGMTHSDVKELQERLRTEGLFSVESKNYFGVNTFKAVKAYQKAHGLPSTGYVGPLTVAELNK